MTGPKTGGRSHGSGNLAFHHLLDKRLWYANVVLEIKTAHCLILCAVPLSRCLTPPYPCLKCWGEERIRNLAPDLLCRPRHIEIPGFSEILRFALLTHCPKESRI